ncbi:MULTISPECIES: acetylornithine deacetylase [unclassified Polaromonas]|uniref:acetylornithine deacetylase n=1 Tax=unclassified Polaromonas TaxID=2638319 RepID=UPI0018CA8536|nr:MULTISPECIES: acetylornithine deacetylase [unclassified Polaromonas]MBG6071348.1 acetylornithine deacetylase [Polaromonas sp. CG_9.7]MBG6113348.1 acetylornithine deacetylase [Polaromonas sp. CG_9.2]MDH6183194.1 acetylornithine deacetylase [Polaromonas sp. CG_23.6]
MTTTPSPALLQPSPDVLAMIERLIAFPTVSRDSNLGMIEWIRDYLAGLGVTSRLTYDAAGKKANLFATLGEGRKPGLILSGHTDVVPVDGQAWDTDPFKATIKEGLLYGRGSCDMKSYIATALALAPRFLAAKMDAPLHLAFSYDEEVGCIGVKSLIADLQDLNLKTAGCIVGEPTSMQPVIAHKGTHRFRCCVTGREAHSSYTNLGVNAIEYAARIIVYIRQMADRFAQLETRDYGFTVPYTTMQTGLIRGGLASNIVPKECIFEFEARTMPGTDATHLLQEVESYAARLLPEMLLVEPNAKIAFERLASAPGLSTQEHEAIVQLAIALSRNKATGAVSYGTEAGLFQGAGIPTVVCGPGSIEQAHRPNEFVPLEQVAQCEAFLLRLLDPVPAFPQ